MRRVALVFTVVAGVLALAGSPAAAHGGDAPDATAYRTTVTTVAPVRPGLTVRAVEAGARLELVNRTGRTIEVLGYAGEPYLELRPDGVHLNVNSPAAYLNETLAGDTPVPATADPTAAPTWRRVSDGDSVRWHDRRTHWTGSDPPEVTVTDPDRTHRLRDWSVPLRDGVHTFEIRGTLDWVPPPAPGLWWAGALAVAAGCVAVRRTRAPLAAAAAIAALTSVSYAGAREVDAGATGPGSLLVGLLSGQLTVLLAAAGTLAAAVLLLTRRPIADFALALAGSGLLLFAGLADVAVFADAVAPAPGPSWWPRVAVAAAVGVGAGLTAVGLLRLRAAAPPRTSRTWKLPPAGPASPPGRATPTGAATPAGPGTSAGPGVPVG